jgi:hypothetical protein
VARDASSGPPAHRAALPARLARAIGAAAAAAPQVPSSGGGIAAVSSGLAGAAAARTIAETAGRPDARHVAHAAEVLGRLHPDVVSAARAPATARALRARCSPIPIPPYARQLAQVREESVRDEAGRLADALAGSSREDRMAALELALPALDSSRAGRGGARRGRRLPWPHRTEGRASSRGGATHRQQASRSIAR